jgi:hypothetical protein
MKWAPGTRDSITDVPYFFVSDCGGYTITIPVGDCDIYLAYRKPEEGSRLPANLLGGYESSKAAKAACEADAQRTP